MQKIKAITHRLRRKYPGQTLRQLSDCLQVTIIQKPLGQLPGAYFLLKRNKIILLNTELTPEEERFVLAHELGHAVMHRKVNCFFSRKYTYLKTNIYEMEANAFAAELLIPGKMPAEYQDYTEKQLANLYEVPVDLIRLKFHLL